jgi:hypothetical protein
VYRRSGGRSNFSCGTDGSDGGPSSTIGTEGKALEQQGGGWNGVGGGVKEELHTKGVNNRTVDLQWVVMRLRGVPLRRRNGGGGRGWLMIDDLK